MLHAFGEPIAVETVPDPACPPDGVVVAVGACAICRSDLDTSKGADAALALPHMMGHELAGVVVATGPDFAEGERVTAPLILGCGRCADCAAERSTVRAAQRLVGSPAGAPSPSGWRCPPPTSISCGCPSASGWWRRRRRAVG